MGRSFSFPLPALRLAARANIHRQLIRREGRYAPPGLEYGVVFQTLPYLVIALNEANRPPSHGNRASIAPEIELRAVAGIVDWRKGIAQTAQQRNHEENAG